MRPGELAARRRRAENHSRRELAARCAEVAAAHGMEDFAPSEHQIQRFEEGGGWPPERIQILARALGCRTDEIVPDLPELPTKG
ncbi:MAG: hypothetical protein H6741_25915 [Alphaproteobacteria bacterium]|nr:hypothetical protein [Alphaproteobacteria bacterium]